MNIIGDSDFDTPPPPPVPRLVFAENVDKILKEKKSAREKEKEKNSDRDSHYSPQSSDTERRSRRERFEEVLKSSQWSVGSSSESIPSPTPLLSPHLSPHHPSPHHTPPHHTPHASPRPPGPVPSNLGPSFVKRTPPSTAQPLPSLERIPEVVPRTHPEPEPTTEHPPEQSLPPNLSLHFEQSPHNTARSLLHTCLCVTAVLLIPIAFLLLLTSIPLEGKTAKKGAANLGDNLVYLLVYQPLWSIVVGLMVWMWMAHQLSILHPESIDFSPRKQILFCILLVSFSFLVPTCYVVISFITGSFPLHAAEYVIILPLLLLFVALYFCMTDREGRALPGFLRNFCVHLLVILLLQVYLGVMIGFIFFFPQLDTFIQIIVAIVYQLLTSLVRWIANYTISKLTFKSFDKYKKGGRDYNNRSTVDVKGGTQPPTAESTPTRTQSVFLQTFLASLNINSSFSSAQAQAPPPPILSPYLSSSSLQYFLVNLHGTSFWPVFFLTYTVGWESFALQLVCALLVFCFFPLRLTDFWFHFSAKSQSSNQRRIWIVAELTMKVDLAEYRKKVCAEFAFHFMSEAISLLAFLILPPPICAGHNARLYLLCSPPGGEGSRHRAKFFALIALGALAAVFAASLVVLRRSRGPRAPPLRSLFAPWQQYVQSYFLLLATIATSSLVFPYQFSLAMNRMAHVP